MKPIDIALSTNKSDMKHDDKNLTNIKIPDSAFTCQIPQKMADKEKSTYISKVKVETFVCVKSVSVVCTGSVLEPLVKIGENIFEGFSFCDDRSSIFIQLFGEHEVIEIEVKTDFFVNEFVSVKTEKYFFESDLYENFLNQTTFIGHRGSGPSKIEENYIENTVVAFEEAFKKGAKWVELDVQLTKDGIPIIFHNIFLTFNDEKIPIINLTYDEIIEIYNKTHNLTKNHENRLLKLKEVLDHFGEEVGFNIEIKYPLIENLDELISYKYIDPYNYVKGILKDINFTNKKVFFSAFNPQILFALKMLNLKKQLYFLLDQTDLISNTHHCNSIYNAIAFAKTLNIAGIVVLDKHLEGESKELIDFIHSQKLKVLAYGDQLNNKEVVTRLIEFGIDGIITDTLDKFIEHFIG